MTAILQFLPIKKKPNETSIKKNIHTLEEEKREISAHYFYYLFFIYYLFFVFVGIYSI
jgi:hypothetical protein